VSFNALTNVFRIAELRQRLLYSVLLLGVYRIGIFITTPGVDRQAMQAFLESQKAGGGLVARLAQRMPNQHPLDGVLDAQGEWIAGVWAAGGCAAGLSGRGAEGYLPGNGLAQSFGLAWRMAQALGPAGP
jgi:hypothetical protein